MRDGLMAFRNWFDVESWYPLGRVVGGTVYPGIMVTAYVEHALLRLLGFPVPIKEICVFMGPVFSVFSLLVVYGMTWDISGSKGAGLAAAAWMCVTPGYVQRSVAGNYDNESVAIFALCLVFFLFIKALRHGSVKWAFAASMAYFYMVSAWGGYIFITNLLPIFMLTVVVTGQYSQRAYVVYCTFVTLGTFLAVQVPFVGFQHVQGSDHLAFFGVFGVFQLIEAVRFVKNTFPNPAVQRKILYYGLGTAVVGGLVGVTGLFLSGKIAPFVGRFYFLLDPKWGRQKMHIIASVGEHQPAKLSSIISNLHASMLFAVPGVISCLMRFSDLTLFPIIWAGVTLYFTTVMNRVVLVAAPVVCILGGIGLSACLRYSFDILHGKQVLNPMTGKKTKPGDPGQLRFLALGLLGVVAVSASKYIQHAGMKGVQFSYPSIVIPSRNRDGGLAIIDDYREAYKWISQNTPEDAKILAWWDYGYHMTSMSNRTVLVDNNTWNNTHIATVGLALASPEEKAVEIFERLDAEYALVIYGGRVGVQSDDISKAYWILRITSGEYPEINYMDYLNPRTGMISMGAEVTPAMKKSLLYKLVYHGLETPQHGYDYVRRQEVKNVEPLEHFEEVFSSTYFMVRVFKRKRHFGPAV